MPKGVASEVGATRWSQNGYHYTRTEKGWILTHYLLAEQKLGRPLDEDERCRFSDGNRKNLKLSNIEIIKKGKSSLRRRKASIETRIEELQAELEEINKQLTE